MQPLTDNRLDKRNHPAATKLQCLARSIEAKKHARLLLWAKYNWAANVIIKAFKKWNALKIIYRSSYRRVRDRRCSNHPRVTNLPYSFSKVIDLKGSYEDKIAMWRLAIELRRGHNMQTTDTCIKAILEAEADLKQAMTYLGIPEFCVRHFLELPKHTKKLFLYENSLSNFQPFEDSNRGSLEMQRSTGIETIRTLKRLQKRQNFINTMNVVVSKSYFSKYHIGSKYTQPAYPKLG